jgi:hypothetical protein
MATARQQLGEKGEAMVSRHVACPRCNRPHHLAKLQRNFQCADLICKFCGYLAQVKAATIPGSEFPDRLLGAAWGPQHEQIIAGIYHGLYLVGFSPSSRLIRIDYVPAHILQTTPEVFEPRRPLSPEAKTAGWQGFYYNLTKLPAIGIHQVYPS